MSIFNRKQTVEIDYDKLANAIVKAQKKTDTKVIKDAIIGARKEINAKQSEEQKQRIEEWQKTIGYNKNKPEWINDFNIFRKLLVIKKKDAIADFANNALLKIATSFLYWILEYLIYFLCILFLVLCIENFNWIGIAITISFDIIVIMIARIVRIARFELDNLNDKNYLISIISTLTSLFALIVAIVTVFVNK